METVPLSLRPSGPADLAAVDALLARSYPRLLAPDYPPSVLVTAVPRIARARPELLASGRYFLVWRGGRLLGAGGFSLAPPGPRGADPAAPLAGLAHVRHVATDPEAVRQGVGRMVIEHVLAQARRAGAAEIEALSTRTAVPFYAALGFRALAEADIPLAPGIVFPAVRMRRAL